MFCLVALQQNQSNQPYCKWLGPAGNSSTQSSEWGRRRRTCKTLYLIILLPGKCRLSGYGLQTRTSLHYAISVFPWKVIAVSDWFPKLNIPNAQNYFHLFKENKNRKTRIDNPKQTSPVQRDWPSIWPAVDANYKWGDPLVRPLGHLVILPPLGHLVSPDLLCDWPIHTQTQN